MSGKKVKFVGVKSALPNVNMSFKTILSHQPSARREGDRLT